MSENMSNPQYEDVFKTHRSIDMVIDLERELQLAENVENYYNVPFRVHSISHRNGKDGAYIVMECENYLTGEFHQLSTGAVIIVNIMTKIDNTNEFPVDCAFHLALNNRSKLIRAIVPQDFE